MEKINDKVQEEKIREYLQLFIKTYAAARSRIGIPVNEKKLSELINAASIELYKDENTTGTFSVNQLDKLIRVIVNNFETNGKERNDFLLLHEMTHLSSFNNVNIYQTDRDEGLKSKFGKYSSVQANNDMSGFDVGMGLIAIEEVTAQWCAEKCDEALGGGPKEPHKETHCILGNDVDIYTTFANHDTYAPLETFVGKFAIKAGYKSIDEFGKDIITGDVNIFEIINNDNVEYIGYIGILCEGIYQENGFGNYGLPETDIPAAIEYLSKQKIDIPFGESHDNQDR